MLPSPLLHTVFAAFRPPTSPAAHQNTDVVEGWLPHRVPTDAAGKGRISTKRAHEPGNKNDAAWTGRHLSEAGGLHATRRG